ncbi:aldose 1-epimerase [soil metagenome]
MRDAPFTLESSNFRLQLLPSYGGRIGRLQARNGQNFIDILCPYPDQDFDPIIWPKCGGFPLIPYSNRIENAEFTFQASDYHLPVHPTASPHTLHGVCHTLPWQVISLGGNMIKLAVEYCGPQWPWPIHAEQCYTLHEKRLDIHYSLKNLGQTPMPGGIGFHPYFIAEDGFEANFQANREWLLGANCLPISVSPCPNQKIKLTPQDWNELDLLGHFSDLAGDIVMQFGSSTISMSTSENLRHLVAFAPKGGKYLCLEPVSHVANMFNLSGFSADEIGMHVIPAGGILTGEVSIRWSETQRKSPF